MCARIEERFLLEILNLDGAIDTEHLAANRDNVIIVWCVVLPRRNFVAQMGDSAGAKLTEQKCCFQGG